MIPHFSRCLFVGALIGAPSAFSQSYQVIVVPGFSGSAASSVVTLNNSGTAVGGTFDLSAPGYLGPGFTYANGATTPLGIPDGLVSSIGMDINNDGTIDILDLVLVGGNFDKTSPVLWP